MCSFVRFYRILNTQNFVSTLTNHSATPTRPVGGTLTFTGLSSTSHIHYHMLVAIGSLAPSRILESLVHRLLLNQSGVH